MTFRDRNVERAQAIGIDLHLVLPHEAAQRRNFGDAGHGFQVIPQVPILIAAQLLERVPACRVDERVLEHPPDAGRVRPELGPHALWKPRQDTGQILHRARSRPVDVGAFLEHDVDVRKAEVGEGAHRFTFGAPSIAVTIG